MENEDGTERLPVSPDMNSTQIECDRDCKVRKQVEKEIAEENLVTKDTSKAASTSRKAFVGLELSVNSHIRLN